RGTTAHPVPCVRRSARADRTDGASWHSMQGRSRRTAGLRRRRVGHARRCRPSDHGRCHDTRRRARRCSVRTVCTSEETDMSNARGFGEALDATVGVSLGALEIAELTVQHCESKIERQRAELAASELALVEAQAALAELEQEA